MSGGGETEDGCCHHGERERIRAERPFSHATFRDHLASEGRVEDALEDQKHRSSAIEAALPIGLFESNREGRIHHANPGFFKLTGLSPEFIVGRSWCDMLFWRSDDPQIGHACMAAVQEQRAWIAETQISRGDGSSLWVLVEALPKFDRKGACNGHIVTLSDISREKQLLERLQENEARLEQARKKKPGLAAQAKAKFLDAASHDLSSPCRPRACS